MVVYKCALMTLDRFFSVVSHHFALNVNENVTILYDNKYVCITGSFTFLEKEKRENINFQIANAFICVGCGPSAFVSQNLYVKKYETCGGSLCCGTTRLGLLKV
jgi:hypothetical protein